MLQMVSNSGMACKGQLLGCSKDVYPFLPWRVLLAFVQKHCFRKVELSSDGLFPRLAEREVKRHFDDCKGVAFEGGFGEDIECSELKSLL